MMAARKRMVSNSIIHTDKFLQMSTTAQLLYFFLLIEADDDGFNAMPQSVMGMCKANREDMRQLVEHGYVLPFESGVIVIRHWLIHNQLRVATYRPTEREEKYLLGAGQNGEYELLSELPEGAKSLVELQDEKSRKKGKEEPLTMTDLKRANKNVRLELDSCFCDENVQPELDTFSKNNVEERREGKRREGERNDNLYGKERNVFLLPDEYKTICERYEQPDKLIDKISFMFLGRKKLPKSHYGYINKIALEDEWPIKKKNEWKPDEREPKKDQYWEEARKAVLEKANKLRSD